MSSLNQKPLPEHEDFFRYTSGRWLWDEQEQLRDRYHVFNVAELQRVAAKSVGSKSCASMTKLAEGQYNKDFRLVMNDGKVVIARLPNPNTGPSFYATASEVATMEFARTVLEIPVPKVYEWSATAHCPVGAEYIMMEEAPGVRLVEVWDELDPDSKLAFMRELVSIETKLLSMSFHSYGSVYFASDMVKGSVPAKLRTDVSPGVKSKVLTQFTIGPLADRKFWNKERSEMDIDRGPWTTPLDYAVAIGRREIAWIDKYAVPKAPDDPQLQSTAQNSPSAHIALLERFLKVVPHLLDVDDRLISSNLWHKGLYSSNVSINQKRITSVTDWQGVWAGPLLLHAQPPDLLEYQGDAMLEYQDKVIVKRPQNFEDLADDEKAQIEQKIRKSMLFQLYLMETKTGNPRLDEVFNLDYGKMRRFPVWFAGNTWDGDMFRDILPFREALINVERYWKELGFDGECPIHFSEDELRSHLEDIGGWNDVQDFFDLIENLVQRDGWTHNETYDAALNLFSELRQEALQNLKGKMREEYEKETRWVEKLGGRQP